MAIHSKGQGDGAAVALREWTSMNDEGPGSVTHGAVMPGPALARLGVVQEREVHF